MNVKKRENNLGTDNIKSLVLRLALPAMAAQFVNVLYGVVDRMYIGNIPEAGELALAGVGICGPVLTMLSSFAFWIGIGGAPLMSIKMGQKDKEGAKKILANCFLMLLVLAGILTAAVYAFQDVLLATFGATEAIMPYASAYTEVYVAGTVFALLSLGLNQFIICQGFSGLGVCSVILGAALNLLLDPVFIFACDMGVAGAAFATVLSQLASCIFTLCVLFSHRLPVRLTFGGYQWKICFRVLLVGVTPFLILMFDNVLIILQNMLLKMYGGAKSDMLLTCNTIVQSFMLMITMPLGGITGGTQAILGYNYGAGNKERIREAERTIILLSLFFTTLMFLLAQFFSRGYVWLFTKDPLYMEQTVRFIRIYTLGVIPLAVQYAIVDGFTGMGLPRFAFPLSFFRKSVYIILLVILCLSTGAETIFFAEPVSDVLAPVVSSVTYLVAIPRILKKA